MNTVKSLLLILVFLINTECLAQTFAQGAKMIRYESTKFNEKSTVEYSYSYMDLGGYETLTIKLLGNQTPSHLKNQSFETYSYEASIANDENHEILHKKMLKKFGITKTSLEETPNCYFEGIAKLEIRELEEWSNHYDADPGNNAVIYLDSITISKPPVYKCES